MSLNVDNLEIIYKKIYEISIQIRQLIDRKIYTELVTFINKKEQLFKEAAVLLEKIQENGEDTSRLEELCTMIKNQEQENIMVLTQIRDGIKKELNKTSKNSKLLNAYSHAELKQGNILDYRQ